MRKRPTIRKTGDRPNNIGGGRDALVVPTEVSLRSNAQFDRRSADGGGRKRARPRAGGTYWAEPRQDPRVAGSGPRGLSFSPTILDTGRQGQAQRR